jgi:hypothetical protein
VTFDDVIQTLPVQSLNLDEVPFTAVYQRAPTLDQAGYLAFTVQDDPLDRHFTAYAAQSNNSGSVRASVIGSGGPRNVGFKGGLFERDEGYSAPDVTENSGLVSGASCWTCRARIRLLWD